MNQVIVRVRPAAGGWQVESSTGLEPQMFLSGGRAEHSARELARTLAGNGQAVKLIVEDRSQTVVGAQLFDGAAA